MRILPVLSGVLGFLACSSASAADAVAPRIGEHASLFSEVRLGLLAHDLRQPEGGTVDIQGQVLFAKPFRLDSGWDVLVPRPHLGGVLNTAGKTSHFDFGVTWTFDVTEKIFVEAAFGGAVHDGAIGRRAKPGLAALGCPVLFREAGAIGYRIDAHWSVMANVEHISNGGLCVKNRGLTNYGAAIGYRF